VNFVFFPPHTTHPVCLSPLVVSLHACFASNIGKDSYVGGFSNSRMDLSACGRRRGGELIPPIQKNS
jgi:hypothetical protein